MPRILIVDDDPKSLYMLEALLKGHGHEVVTAVNGSDALQTARQAPPEAIVSDFFMPTMDGFALCRECKKDDRLRGVPFIAYTATYTDPKDEALALGLGAARFLIKPIEPDVLLREIEKVLADSKAGRLAPPPEPAREAQFLREYNEALIRKLEKKVAQFQETNLALREEISWRERAESQRRESEQKFRELIENAPEAIFVQSQGRFVYLNPAMLRLLGAAKPEELLDTDFTERIAPEYQEVIRERIRFQRETGRMAPPMDQEFVRLDGSRVPVETTAVAIRHQGREAHLVFVRDITERKQREKQVAAYQRRLRSLGSKLAMAEEAERRRIAAGLHDNVVQSLVAAKMILEGLAIQESAQAISPDLQEIKGLLSQSLQDTRSLLFDLSPVVLYELGFGPALESLLELFKKTHGMTPSFRTDDLPKPMTNDVRVVLFRAVREVLQNVAKHAHAESVSVSIQSEGERIFVEIQDDGLGFDPEKTLSMSYTGGGFGLLDVRERLDHLGGNLTIRSEPGRGTTVVLGAPLAHEESVTER
jgi:PAS domain S-box-containing protein